MPIGFFLDKMHQPSGEEIAAALGAAKPLWDRLLAFIAETYQMPGRAMQINRELVEVQERLEELNPAWEKQAAALAELDAG